MDMMSMNKYYCYALLDQRKPGRYSYEGVDASFLYEPFYIGKGSGNRVTRHFRELRRFSENEMKWSRVKAIQNQTGEDPWYVIIEDNMDENASLLLEILMIDKIGRKHLHKGPLLNLQEGGSMPPKFNDFDEEKKERIREKFRNKIQSDATKRKRASSNRGKKRTIEFCHLLSEMRMGDKNPMFGKKQSDETKRKKSLSLLNNKNSKAVVQLSLSGEFIKRWPSMGEAERGTGVQRSKICATCKGKRIQSGGFLWSYE
jgi:hypothetical protein